MKRKIATAEKLQRILRRSGVLLVEDADLEGINLSQRAILGVVFRRCELANASFKDSDLSLTRFIDCGLYQADFSNAVLYTTWFYECNMTKASFHGAYLFGFRCRNVDITKVEFDKEPKFGLERKNHEIAIATRFRIPILSKNSLSGISSDGALYNVVTLGKIPCTARQLETCYSGITMQGFSKVVEFIQEADMGRTFVRAAETAKFLRSVHEENGYESSAVHYYVVERRLRRKALNGTLSSRIRRAQDFIFGELTWKYGASVLRPMLALFGLTLTASLITYLAPILTTGAGLRTAGSAAMYQPDGITTGSLVNYGDIVYFYLTAPTGVAGGSPAGWVRIVFVLYLLTALWLIALIFEASTRRIGKS